MDEFDTFYSIKDEIERSIEVLKISPKDNLIITRIEKMISNI